MPKNEVREVLDIVANSLASAAPLATALRRGLGDAGENAVAIESALHRAVNAMRRLQPKVPPYAVRKRLRDATLAVGREPKKKKKGDGR